MAPGVGTGTDMFTIGPLLGSYSSIGHDVLSGIEKIYQETQQANREAIQRAEVSANKYMEEITEAASAKKEQNASVKIDAGASLEEIDE